MNKDIENDSKKNIEISDKQWHALMKKVDSAINTFAQDIKEEKEEKQLQEINNELI